MNKKLMIGIIVVIVLAIIGLIFGTYTVVRFVKIQNIYSKLDEYVAKENYYLRTTIKFGDSTTNTETRYLDGVGKMVANNGVYLWSDDEVAYLIDEAGKTIHSVTEDDNISSVKADDFAVSIPGYSYNFLGRLVFAADPSNKIKNEEIDGAKYIVFETETESAIKRVYVSATRTYISKAEIILPNGEKFEYNYTIRFGETKKADVYLPDIQDYTLVTGGLEIETKTFLEE